MRDFQIAFHFRVAEYEMSFFAQKNEIPKHPVSKSFILNIALLNIFFHFFQQKVINRPTVF